MIARFNIILPFPLSIRPSEELSPYDTVQGPYRVRIYPPCQAELKWVDLDPAGPIPFGEVVKKLQPAEPQTASPVILIDNAPTIQANLLQIDFRKEAFDRRRTTDAAVALALTSGDPPLQLAFGIANGLLTRIRFLTRGTEIHELDPLQTPWRVDYLTEEGKHLPRDPELQRRRFGKGFSFRAVALTRSIWQKVHELAQDFVPWPWDTLLLDAEALLPDIDASIALANAALEAFSKWLLDELAAQHNLPGGLWQWINERGFWLKDPSVDDRFGPLLKIFAGRTLKEDKPLWEAYKNLRAARNSFSHRGRPMIGDKEVTPELATALVEGAKRIVDWCEELLPTGSRRPKSSDSLVFSFEVPVGDLPTLPDPGQGHDRAEGESPSDAGGAAVPEGN